MKAGTIMSTIDRSLSEYTAVKAAWIMCDAQSSRAVLQGAVDRAGMFRDAQARQAEVDLGALLTLDDATLVAVLDAICR